MVEEAGDRLAEVEVAYARHCDELVRFAALMVGPSCAEDVVADAMVSVLRSRSTRPILNWRAYLYRVVLRRAGSFAQNRNRARAGEERSAEASYEYVVDLDPGVRAAVDRLSARQRAVVLLAYWQDLTPNQIARLLGIGEGSVRRHLARARAALRKELDHD